MYKEIYYSTFKDANNNTIRIEILKDTNGDVKAKELILCSDSVTIDYQGNDDVFYPSKCSGCKISVLTEGLLLDLYSGKANEICCKVYRNDALFWFGFITPNIYNSDYTERYNKLDLEFIDSISNLANYNYTYVIGKQAITSFYDIIVHILNKVDTEKIISNIYVQNSRQINGSTDLLNELFINERNFYDEEEESEKCKDVLEYIASYLGMTIIQFENSLYLVDYETFNKSSYTGFIRYSRTGNVATRVTLSSNTININENVFRANASISLNDIYNKIVVIGNSNPIGDLIPDLFDEDDLVNQNVNPNHYTITERIIDKVNYTMLASFFKSQHNWNCKKLTVGGLPVEEITADNLDALSNGAFWQKVFSYKTEDEPSGFSWQQYLTFYCPGAASYLYAGWYLQLKNKQHTMFKGGYFIINLAYKMSKYLLAHTPLITSDDKYFSNQYNNDGVNRGFDDTLIPCRLAIGNYYYNGERFVNYEEHSLKTARGYYKIVLGKSHVAGAKWYYYIDQYGYKRYVTQSEYNALSSATTKACGDCIKNRMYYFTNDSDTRVFVEEDYYYECMLKDRFLLVHKNKVDDKIFDENKQLTNTVSYKMNLVDSEDGVAIKLPVDKILEGEMTFEIFQPNHLGVQPCTSTAGSSDYCYAFHFSDLLLKYTTDKYAVDIFNMGKYELDQKYENEIDSDNITEFDDLELRVNTYNPHAGSYSYVIHKKGNNYDYVDNITNTNTGENAISEAHVINKYHDYYSCPKFVYSNTLRGANRVTPLTKFHENTLNKDFRGNSLHFNLNNNSVDISANEI